MGTRHQRERVREGFICRMVKGTMKGTLRDGRGIGGRIIIRDRGYHLSCRESVGVGPMFKVSFALSYFELSLVFFGAFAFLRLPSLLFFWVFSFLV